MLVLNSCITSAQKAKQETTLNAIYIPSFPDPLDKDGNNIVTFSDDYTQVIMPYWYWLQITNYAVNVENAAQVINKTQ